MRRTVLLAAMLLGGCGFDMPPPKAPESAREAVAAATVPEAPDALARAVARLAAGGRGFLRYDRVQDGVNAGSQRQAYVEMLGATAEEAAAIAADALVQMGYREVHRKGTGDRVRLAFDREGEPTIHVIARSRAVHAKLLRQDATSSVYMFQVLDR